ncbi:type II toxin-antitoxin system RelE/ParE family toxin [Brevundimonas sp. SL130]|uniref:type II toxin-antitoxin system RelE/ParE family toxin n=1 Tax=Brevundimonas sp. SL130 TaxID=2995143 RepID=UPI00226D1922|nr:type II toxin-antitoxin system RelE/ParE family toxin [Brevundimonas sp. SL130]WAC60980.1 type II toxin-antitoxin system RelE/ParE family toxin [Brevundimonas sp. SL130]
MRFTVVVLPSAQRDLLRLTSFLAEAAPSAVERMRAVVKEALRSLSDMPNRGQQIDEYDRRLKAPFGEGAYVIIYRVEQRRVVVSHDIHSREDWHSRDDWPA